MTAKRRSDWLIPTGLILLALVPAIAGTYRLFQLGSGAAITPENARFVEAPWPVVVHIISVIIYCVLGAFQFSPGFRRRRPGWHRASGRVLVPLGLASALSGLWMTWTYPFSPGDGVRLPADGVLLYDIRQVVGAAMFLAVLLGFAAVRRRDFTQHRAWMIRAYAIGQGAGTQVVTSIAWLVVMGAQSETQRAWVLGAGWGINVVVAEWIIRRKTVRRMPLAAALTPASSP